MTNQQIMFFSFLLFLFLKIITQLYLSVRNTRYITRHKDKVPTPFADKISLEDHQKAHRYTITNAVTGRLFLFIDLGILLFWLYGGGINLLNEKILLFNLGPIATGVIFFLAFGMINTLLGIPESIYHTFVIEEKFGFNKTTPKIFITDLIKQFFLGIIIGGPILALILWIMHSLGSLWWIYAFVALTLFQFFVMAIYPNFIAPLFNKFSPLEEGELKERIEALLKKIDFSHSGLFIMDASKRSAHGNAYFTGLGKTKRIVFFDTLINSLSPEEAEAVLAHELGHFKKRHIIKNIIVSLIFSFVGLYILGLLYESPWFYHSLGVDKQSSYLGLLLFSMVSPVYTFFITPISAWFSRKHEFEADDFAATHSNADKLIEALVKLYKENATTLTPDPLYSAFYHSHPPALIRIKNLQEKNL